MINKVILIGHLGQDTEFETLRQKLESMFLD